jgi:outer membrane protein assembly factor BamB
MIHPERRRSSQPADEHLISHVASMGCQPRYESDPDPVQGLTQKPPLWTTAIPDGMRGPVRGVAVEDLMVLVSEGGGVMVLDRATGSMLWHTLGESSQDGPPRRVRVAAGSVVLIRHNVVEVLDLRTGEQRRRITVVQTVSTSWTTLFVKTGCLPDCQLHAYDLRTDRQLWQRPGDRIWHGNVMLEPGEPATDTNPASTHRGESLLAPEAKVILLRNSGDSGEFVLAVDALTGRELSQEVPSLTRERISFGTDRRFLSWTEGRDCVLTLTGRDVRTGSVIWSAEVGSRRLSAPGACVENWLPERFNGTLLALVGPDARPRVLDIDTGMLKWVATEGQSLLGMGGGMVLTVGEGRLSAVAVQTGSSAWAMSQPRDAHGVPRPVSDALVSGPNLAYATQWGQSRSLDDLLWLRDVSRGEVRWYDVGVKPVGIGPDWLVAVNLHEARYYRL